jgi:hypothetical protein
MLIDLRNGIAADRYSQVKAMITPPLRWTTQVCEPLCKVLGHNICGIMQSMYELGVEAGFWKTEEP